MELKRLHFGSSLASYEKQADELLAAVRAGRPEAVRCFNERHPRFLDARIRWLPKKFSDSDIQNSGFDLDDAQLALARWYDFRDWPALTEQVEAMAPDGSAVHRFEFAVEAVIAGDLAALEGRLCEHPELVRVRSTRVTHFDPPRHRATLLHYVAANGVEGYRQKTPTNAVEIARALLQAGAEVDALADMYGGQCTTMSLLVSSCHPAKAGLQGDLAETLLEFGASLEGAGTGRWVSPLMTALVFGYLDTARRLEKRGARMDNLAVAAGLGRLEEARRLLPEADGEIRHRALALAAQLGHVNIVRLLLEAGEDSNRHNPEGLHAHSTPLHQAALAGHRAVVKMLVEHGARLDIRDTIYQGTPRSWAAHAGQTGIEDYLRSLEAEGHPGAVTT